MSENVDRLQVEFVADTSQFTRNVHEAQSAMDGFNSHARNASGGTSQYGRAISNAASQSRSSASGFRAPATAIQQTGRSAVSAGKQVSALGSALKAAAAAVSVAAIVNFSKSCIELGSNLAEVQNVVDTTFATMSAKVNEFAQNAAMTYGLSETMAKKYVSNFGAMAESMGFTEQQAYGMSTALTGLAGDVASFYNISQDEAYTKLKSVFTGETESLKELGVVMNQANLQAFALSQGLNSNLDSMSQSELVALRYQYVMQALSNAQGDFARTSNSWANQTRLLSLQWDSFKANLGQAFIAVLTPVLQLLNGLMTKLVQATAIASNFFQTLFGGASKAGSALGSIAGTVTGALAGSKSSTPKVSMPKVSMPKVSTPKVSTPKVSTPKVSTPKVSVPKETIAATKATAAATADTQKAMKVGADSSKKISNNMEKTSKKAKEIKKDLGSLAGLDQINNIAQKDASSNPDISKTPSVKTPSVKTPSIKTPKTSVPDIGGTSPLDTLGLGDLGDLGDLGNLGNEIFPSDIKDTISPKIEKMCDTIKKAIDFAKKLGDEFSKGLSQSLKAGGFKEAIDSIVKSVKSIINTLKDIFTDPGVIAAAKGMMENVAKGFGLKVGGILSIGANIANNLITGLAKALEAQKGRIKDCLIKVFTNSGLAYLMTGEIVSMLGEISKVFSSPAAINVTNNLLQMFIIAGTTIAEIGSDLALDLISGVRNILADNKEGIADTLGGMFKSASRLTTDFKDGFASFCDGLKKVYESNIRPAISNVSKAISKVLKIVLDGYNNYVQPVVDSIVKNVGNLWKNHLSPFFTKVLDTITKKVSAIAKIWNTYLAPVVKTIVDTVGPVICSVAKTIYDTVGPIIGGIIDALKGVMTTAGGLIDFITGVFTGDWQQAWDGLVSAFQGIIDGIVGMLSGLWDALKNLVKGILDILESLVESIINLVDGLIDIVVSTVENIVKAVVGLFKKAWSEIKKAWSAVVPFFKSVWDGIKNVFSAACKVLGGFFSAAWNMIKKTWGVVVSFFKGVWDGIKNVFSATAKTLGGFFSAAWDAVKKAWSATVNFFKGIWDGIKNVFSVAGRVLGQSFSAAWNAVKKAWDAAVNFFKSIWNGIKNVFNGVGNWFGNVFKGAYNKLTSAFNGIKNFFGGIWSGIKNVFSGVGSWFGNIFQSAYNNVKGIFDGMVNVIRVPINGIVSLWNNTVGSIRIEIPSWVPAMGGKSFGFPKLPYMEKGGIINGATPLIAGENGAEAIVPLENNTEWIDKVANKIVAGLTASGGTDKDINLNLVLKVGDTVFGKKSVEAIRSYGKQKGKDFLLDL